MRYTEHKAYPSIENHTNKKYIDGILEDLKDIKKPVDWIATEKIHGANVQIHVYNTPQGLGVEFGSRNKMLDLVNDNFYGLNTKHVLYPVLEEGAKLLYEKINKKYEIAIKITKIIIYGELFGGSYPLPKKNNTGDVCIQKGVLYSPGIEFRIFDILMVFEIESNEFGKWLEIYHEVNDLLAGTGLRTVPVFAWEGSLESLLNHSFETYQSQVPSQLNLPEIPNNWIEGVVIRPSTAVLDKYGHRIMIKKKNENFHERKAVPKRGRTVPKVGTIIPNEIQEFVLSCITKQRLENIASHDGLQINQENIGQLLRSFVKDIVKEVLKDHLLEDDILKLIPKFINSRAVRLIKEYE